jgi:hypothetical protein
LFLAKAPVTEFQDNWRGIHETVVEMIHTVWREYAILSPWDFFL